MEETIELHHYEVTGLTPDHLRASFMRRPNPMVMATTEAGIFVQYDFAFGNGECRLMQAHINMEMDITYPLWREEAQGSEEMRAEWSRFMEALEVHEEGHVIRFRQEAENLRRRLAEIEPAPACGAIRSAVERAKERFDRDVNRIQTLYETETDFGRTQGARLRFR